MRLCILVLFTLLFSFTGYSQSKIRGVLRDPQENRFIPNATVQLYQPSDSLPFKSVISRAGGRFQLTGINFGNYRIRISTVGYELIDILINVRDTLFDFH